MNNVSLLNKMDKLCELSNANNTRLIRTSETLISPITDQEIAMSGMSLFYNDRTTVMGDGVALYLLSCLAAHQVYTQEFINFDRRMYTGSDNSTEAHFFNLIENLGLLENVELATRWRNSRTPSTYFTSYPQQLHATYSHKDSQSSTVKT